MNVDISHIFPPSIDELEPLQEDDHDLVHALQKWLLSPENGSLLNYAAREAMARHYRRRACLLLRRLIELEPERLSAYMDLSSCLTELGRLKEAVDTLVLLLTLPDATSRARTWAKKRLQELVSHEDRPKPSEKQLRSLETRPEAKHPVSQHTPKPQRPSLSISPDLVEMAGRVGFSVTQYQGGDGAAVEEAVKFLECYPDRPDVLDWAAFTFYCNGELEKALECYQKLDAMGKGDASALYYMGAIHFRTGNDEEAVSMWLRLIDSYPNHGVANKAAEKLKVLLAGD